MLFAGGAPAQGQFELRKEPSQGCQGAIVQAAAVGYCCAGFNCRVGSFAGFCATAFFCRVLLRCRILLVIVVDSCVGSWHTMLLYDGAGQGV